MNDIIKYFRDLPGDENIFTPISLQFAICKEFNIEENDLLSKCRKQQIINARRLYFYILKTVFKMGWTEIGLKTGFDHSTIIYSYRKCEDILVTEERYLDIANNILIGLRNGKIKL